ncbi:MAG: hypothetical protein NE330_23870 [Lentisphaeraceae bacterium]|nr:hypothetical protein [Lentisphaeraceae bacterium]
MAYEQERDEAYQDILEDGFLGEVIRTTKTGKDLVQDTDTTTTTRDPAAMLSLPVNSGKSTFDNRYDEDLRKGKIRFYMVAAKGISFELESGDYLLAQGVLYEVIGATPFQPSDTIIFYNVGCKKSTKQGLN